MNLHISLLGLRVKFLLAFLLSVSLLLPALSYAQSGALSESENSVPTPAVESSSGVTSCSEFFSRGSVRIIASPYTEGALPSLPLEIGGTVYNTRSYPIIDGQVWMKVFKLDNRNESNVERNGHPLTDFILVEDGITLAPNGERAINFYWTPPANIEAGEYETAFYFTTAYRYNLLGLSYTDNTDNLTGKRATFTVPSTSDRQAVTFNKNTVRLNDTEFSFALPPPRFPADEDVNAFATLVNPSNEERVVEVTWIVSKWDGLREQNEFERSSEGILLTPRETKELEFPVPYLEDSAVTFIRAIVTDGDVSSQLQIRLVRDDFSETRISFPSVFTYPLVAGEEATIFSCLQSTSLPLVPGQTLTLTLTDKSGQVVHQYVYQGTVTEALMAVKDTFVPEKSLNYFTLTASLSNEEGVIEEVSLVYDCEQIDASLCQSDAVFVSSTQNGVVVLVGLAIVVIALLASLLIYQRRRLPMITSDSTEQNN